MARLTVLVPILFTLVSSWCLTFQALAYTVEIDDPLTGGDFYKTITTGEGRYRFFSEPAIPGSLDGGCGGLRRDFAVPPSVDVDRMPTLCSELTHPVFCRSGMTGKLNVVCTVLSAGEGWSSEHGRKLGTAEQVLNIGGTFRIVPEGDEPATGFVNLVAKGLIDGLIGVDTKVGAGPPTVSFGATIFIEHLGTASASNVSDGSQSETLGVKGTLAKAPGVEGSIGTTTQANTAGTKPSNFFMLGKVPINTPINWNFTFDLKATNTENFLGGSSAAWSWVIQQFVNLTPQGKRHVFKKEDPLLSDTVFAFDAGTGELKVLHPNSSIGALTVEATTDDAGQPEPAAMIDFSTFLHPEVDAILSNGTFSTDDVLLGSLMRYSGMFLAHSSGGIFTFTDGLLEFLDPEDQLTVMATMQITDIVADSVEGEFSAFFTDFTPLTLNVSQSPLAQLLIAGGGPGWFDPDIIDDSSGFTTDATSSPYTVDIMAAAETREIPTLSTWGMLVLIGMMLIGALWLLGR